MNNELTVYDYWRIVNRRKWVVLFAFAGTLLSTAFYTRLQPTVFKSQAMIRIQPPASYAKMPGADMNWDPWGMIVTEIRVIQSSDIAERAVRNLGWATPSSSAEEISRAMGRVSGAYKAERFPESNLISISASGADPLLATDIVNAVVEAYSAYDLEERSRQAKKTLEDIASRKNEVEESLRSIERARQNFLEQNPGTGLANALSSQLLDLESRRKELTKKYTSSHPEVMQMDQRIQSVQSKLAELPSQETELVRLTRELRINEEIYTTLNRQYEEAKIALASVVSFVSVVNRAVPPDSPVSPNKRVNFMIGSVLGLFLGLVLAFFIENLDVSITTIEEIERLLELPVLGIIPHMPGPRYLDNWLFHLFRKPRYDMETFRQVLIFHHRPKSPVIEAYHTLHANIASQINSKGSLALVFSSSGVAEGKTLTTANFCIAAAHAGLNTLLVDTDMRSPALYRVFGLDREPGITEILSGKTHWRETLHSTADFLMGELSLEHLLHFPGIDNLKIITCGMPTANIIDTIDSERWPALIQEWKKDFDLIVFDSTPVLLFVDPVIIARHCDGVVLVYKAGKMARGALKRAKEQVVGGNAKMIGVALNDMRASEIGPHYGYYYDYGHYSQPDRIGKTDKFL